MGIAGNRSTIGNLSERLDRLEARDKKISNGIHALSESEFQSEFLFGLTEEQFFKLSPMEQYILRFNWYVREIMPYYKEEVMSVHGLTSEEYDRRVLEGDESIYLPQPNKKFTPTLYLHRIAAVLGLDWQTLQDMISRGEIKDRIAGRETGCLDSWRDEDPNAVF